MAIQISRTAFWILSGLSFLGLLHIAFLTGFVNIVSV
jgi:hypothetical protein